MYTCVCMPMWEGLRDKEQINQCSGWAVRLTAFSGWLRAQQQGLIVPTPIECFLPQLSASAFEEG